MKESNASLVIMKVLVMMYIITMCILVILAAIMLKMSPSATFISAGMIISYIISTFIGGFIIGKKKKKQKYLWGLMMGVLYFVVLLAVSVLLQRGFDLQVNKMISTFFVCAIGGMFGGMVS